MVQVFVLTPLCSKHTQTVDDWWGSWLPRRREKISLPLQQHIGVADWIPAYLPGIKNYLRIMQHIVINPNLKGSRFWFWLAVLPLLRGWYHFNTDRSHIGKRTRWLPFWIIQCIWWFKLEGSYLMPISICTHSYYYIGKGNCQ